MKENPHLLEMVKEPHIRLHPIEGAKRSLNNGDMVKLSSQNGTLTAKVKLDDKVAENTVVVPIGFEKVAAYELGPNLINGLSVGIEHVR